MISIAEFLYYYYLITCSYYFRCVQCVIFSPTTVRGDEYSRSILRSSVKMRYSKENACSVEQVHISLGRKEGSIIVSYATMSLSSIASYVYYSTNINAILASDYVDHNDIKISVGSSRSYSSLVSINPNLIDPVMGTAQAASEIIVDMQNTSLWAFDPLTKEHYGNWVKSAGIVFGPMASNNPRAIYDSPQLHRVILEDLVPGTTYFYRPKGSCEVFSFTAPFRYSKSEAFSTTAVPTPYPFMIGLLSDLGQTRVSEVSIAAIEALDPAVTLLAGDLSYADGWPLLWDSFGRMMQTVFAYTPLLTTGGNHEMASSEGWQHYEARYPVPHTEAGQQSTYWGLEVGPVHVIALNSYAGTGPNSRQYQWLVGYLGRAIDRRRTPWLVVIMHVPWYSTNSGHFREAELMRAEMEKVLYRHGVDLVVAGHNHAYERTHPMYRGAVDACGPVHLTVGDAGNYEGVLVPWRTPQERWSAFREASFGVSGLQLINDTHAVLSWHRHACASATAEEHIDFSDGCVSPGDNSDTRMETSDSVWIVRPDSSRCANRHVSTAGRDAAASGPV